MRRHLLFLTRGLPIVLLLAGCLSVETDVSLRADGSGRVGFRYRIEEAAYDLGVFDEAGARHIPVSEREFAAAAQRIDGLSLTRYRQRRTDGVVAIEADLQFDSVDALRSLLGPDTLRITLRDAEGSWVQQITPGSGAAEVPELLAEALSSYTLTLRLAPPRAARQARPGSIGDDGHAELVLSLADMVRAAGPIEWVVDW